MREWSSDVRPRVRLAKSRSFKRHLKFLPSCENSHRRALGVIFTVHNQYRVHLKWCRHIGCVLRSHLGVHVCPCFTLWSLNAAPTGEKNKCYQAAFKASGVCVAPTLIAHLSNSPIICRLLSDFSQMFALLCYRCHAGLRPTSPFQPRQSRRAPTTRPPSRLQSKHKRRLEYLTHYERLWLKSKTNIFPLLSFHTKNSPTFRTTVNSLRRCCYFSRMSAGFKGV